MVNYTNKNKPYYFICERHKMCKRCIIKILKHREKAMNDGEADEDSEDEEEETDSQFIIIKCPYCDAAVNISPTQTYAQILRTYFKLDVKWERSPRSPHRKSKAPKKSNSKEKGKILVNEPKKTKKRKQ